MYCISILFVLLCDMQVVPPKKIVLYVLEMFCDGMIVLCFRVIPVKQLKDMRILTNGSNDDDNTE